MQWPVLDDVPSLLSVFHSHVGSSKKAEWLVVTKGL